jgi:hypothetical protein
MDELRNGRLEGKSVTVVVELNRQRGGRVSKSLVESVGEWCCCWVCVCAMGDEAG